MKLSEINQIVIDNEQERDELFYLLCLHPYYKAKDSISWSTVERGYAVLGGNGWLMSANPLFKLRVSLANWKLIVLQEITAMQRDAAEKWVKEQNRLKEVTGHLTGKYHYLINNDGIAVTIGKPKGAKANITDFLTWPAFLTIVEAAKVYRDAQP